MKLSKHLNIGLYGGFTPTGTPTETQAMMPSFWKKDPRVDQALKAFTPQPVNEGTPPEAPQDSIGSYTLHSGDTLESIALQVYGDASLWYLIADANGITQREDRAGERGSQLHAGQSLTIPPAASSQHHTNATHKVLSSADWLGNTSATTPLPPAPPPQPLKKRNSPWRILSLVAVAVVATVATVLTAGALGAALGATVTGTGLGGLLGLGTAVLAGSTGAALGGSALLGSLSVGFAAGFIGSLAGQGAANILGLQQGIDVKGALITGLATAATAGVGRLLSENSAYQSAFGSMDKHKEYFSIKSASEMMERDVLSQSINMGARKHQHLDWLELGISAATAGFIGSNQGNRLNEGLDHTFKKAAPTVSSELHSLTKGALTSVATGARFDAAQILTDNLGQAVADNLVQLGSFGANEAKEGAVDAAKKALKEAENNKAVEKMLKDKANLRAEQENGAWKTNILDDLSYSSDLFKSWEPPAKKYPRFDMKAYWKAGKNQLENSPLASTIPKEDSYGELYGSKLIGVINNEPRVVGQGALDVKTNSVGRYDIDYDALLVKKPGHAYREDQIVSHSQYLKSPGSPIWGDASREVQIEAIDHLITASIKKGLGDRDTAYVLAIAHVESGFNPYAAAGTTSAAGLGQFTKRTGRHYGLKGSLRWDVEKQADALVRHYVDNKNIAMKRNLSESYIYKFHHDGPTGEYGGLALSNKHIMPKIGVFNNAIYKIF